MTRRPPLLTLLASLAIHIGALALLLVFASEESHPSALFIDLSVQEVGAVSERKAGVASERTAATTGGGLRQMRAGSARQIERVTAAPPAVAPAPPSSPEPAPPPEREVTTSRPPEPRQAEPALGAVASRETAPEGVAPSSASASAVEASTKPGGASADQTSATSASDVGHRATPAPSAVSGESTGRTGARVALAPTTGSLGGEPGSEYGGYLAHVRRRIQESLQYPLAARRRGLKGTVHLEILIKPNGAISAVSVTSSSSHRLLDEAALEAVRGLAPQPFPSGLMPRPLRVRLPVVFDLQ